MKKLFVFLWMISHTCLIYAQTDYTKTADQYFALGNYAKALNYYGKALKTDTTNVKLLHQVGFCMINLKGQELSATEYFNHALRLDSADVVANYNLGIIYMHASTIKNNKLESANFKTLAQTYLKKAALLGNKDAGIALKNLSEN